MSIDRTGGDVDACRHVLVQKLCGKARQGLVFPFASLRSTVKTWYFLVVKAALSWSARQVPERSVCRCQERGRGWPTLTPAVSKKFVLGQ